MLLAAQNKRRIARRVDERRQKAVVVIAIWFRRCIRRKRFQRLRYRNKCDTNTASKQCHPLTELCCNNRRVIVKLQAFVRRSLAYRRYQKLKESVETLQRLFRGEVARRQLLDARCEEQLDEESVNAHYFGQAEKLWAVALSKLPSAHIPCVFDVRFGYEELVGKLWGQALHEAFQAVTNVKEVSFSESVLCLLTTNGDVFVYGWSDRGQLGLGKVSQTDAPTRLDPATFRGLSKPMMESRLARNTTNSGRTWSGSLYGQVNRSLCIRKVVVGSDHTILLDSGGSLFGFGDNSGGQLGIDALKTRSQAFLTTPYLIPLQAPAVDVACGPRHTVVILKAGFIFHWGIGMTDPAASEEARAQCFTHTAAGVLHNAVQVFAGHNTCFLLCSDGRLHSWGSNINFQLGQEQLGRNAFVHKPTLLTRAQNQGGAAMLRVRKFAAGTHHCVAVGQDQAVIGWGSNKHKQLSLQPTAQFPEITTLDYTKVSRPRASHVWVAERFSIIYHIDAVTNDAFLSVLGETAWHLPDAVETEGQLEYYATEMSRPRLKQHLLRVSDNCRTLMTQGYVRGNRAMSCFVLPSQFQQREKVGTPNRPRKRTQSTTTPAREEPIGRSRSQSMASTAKDARSVRSHSPFRLARGTQSTTARRFSSSGLSTLRYSPNKQTILSPTMLDHLQFLIDG